MFTALLSMPAAQLQFGLVIVWLAVGVVGVLLGLLAVVRANRRFRDRLHRVPADSYRHFDTAGVEVLSASR